MAAYFKLNPEVSPMLGENVEMDTSVHPPIVSKLHLEFEGWLGDELLECFPCFAISRRLADKVEESGLGKFEMRDLEVTIARAYAEEFGNIELPEFKWFYVTGEPGQDDFGLTEKANLVVSEAALGVLRQGRLEECEIGPFEALSAP